MGDLKSCVGSENGIYPDPRQLFWSPCCWYKLFFTPKKWTERNAFLAIPGQHVDPEGGCGTRRVLQHRTDLGLVSISGKSMTTVAISTYYKASTAWIVTWNFSWRIRRLYWWPFSPGQWGLSLTRWWWSSHRGPGGTRLALLGFRSGHYFNFIIFFFQIRN